MLSEKISIQKTKLICKIKNKVKIKITKIKNKLYISFLRKQIKTSMAGTARAGAAGVSPVAKPASPAGAAGYGRLDGPSEPGQRLTRMRAASELEADI